MAGFPFVSLSPAILLSLKHITVEIISLLGSYYYLSEDSKETTVPSGYAEALRSRS
jgi:hypothetical protein